MASSSSVAGRAAASARLRSKSAWHAWMLRPGVPVRSRERQPTRDQAQLPQQPSWRGRELECRRVRRILEIQVKWHVLDTHPFTRDDDVAAGFGLSGV